MKIINIELKDPDLELGMYGNELVRIPEHQDSKIVYGRSGKAYLIKENENE